ncbi:hypothetical protein A9Q99_17170 [Gammaproteobacteria bacterium 45_16_T64]|nr:hypothetical protein A9Q99_17170 [Gammaproteobacteria bacterium 45_16_T64]
MMANAHTINPCLKVLRGKVREGTEPENPLLIALWLNMENEGENESSLSIVTRREMYVAQFQLLLDVVVDDLVPGHWRRLCLDHIYQPLSSLKKISDGEHSEQKIRKLLQELAVSCRYIEHGLTN